MEKKTPNLWGGIMEKLKLGSVLDTPLAALIVIATLFAILILKDSTRWLLTAFFVIIVVVLILLFAVYVYWTFKDPDKLRPSEHEIRKFEIMHNMGDNTNIIEGEKASAQADRVQNPLVRQLEKGKARK
jgi:energy-coupling factor transporter transmembrane protein EcfT